MTPRFVLPLRVGLVLAAFAAFGLNSAAHAQSGTTYTYTLIDPVGTGTSVSGINDSGQIVGSYQDPADTSRTYGYVKAPNDSYVTVSPFGSSSVAAYGINDAGLIVGTYISRTPNTFNFYGYVGTPAGGFTTINPFSSAFAEALGVSSAGQIAGDYQDPNSGPTPFGQGSIYGYVGSADNGFTKVDPFGSDKTVVHGINDSGQIAGYYVDPQTGHYLGYTGTVGSDTFVTISPFGSTNASVLGINNAGQIVGVYQDPRSGGTYGYVGAVGSSSFTTVTPFDSGFADSRIEGINNVGQIVGSYRDPRTGMLYGFLGTPNAPVPEASSVVSFGLLLGLGGLGVSVRRRKAA